MKKVLLSSVVLLSALALVACSDSDESSNSSTQQSTATTVESKDEPKATEEDLKDFIAYAEPKMQEAVQESGFTITMRTVGLVVAVAVDNEIKYQDTATIQNVADSTQTLVRSLYDEWAADKEIKVTNKYSYPILWLEAQDGTKVAKDSTLKRTMKLESDFLGR